jgi:hypothetical protein
MMIRKNLYAMFFVFGMTVCGTASSAIVKYNFSQSGYDEGAVVTGMFEGEDTNGDGVLVGNDGPGGFNEVTGFNLEFSGNSIVPAFTFDFADFANNGTLVYDSNDGSFLGDSFIEGLGLGEGLIVIGHSGAIDDFGIILGECVPNDCGDVFSEGLVTQSSELMKVSAVPLPVAVWLFGSSLVGLIGMRQIKSFYKIRLN